jgi:hypothetical protein
VAKPRAVPHLSMWQYLAPTMASANRLYRHPIMMFGVGPAYLFILRCAGARQRVFTRSLARITPAEPVDDA